MTTDDITYVYLTKKDLNPKVWKISPDVYTSMTDDVEYLVLYTFNDTMMVSESPVEYVYNVVDVKELPQEVIAARKVIKDFEYSINCTL